MAPKPRFRVQASSVPISLPALTTDSFANVVAHIGQQTRNVSAGADYGFNPVTRMRTRLEFMYRGSWLVRKVVDQPANDMTRAGVDIDSSIPPEQIEDLHADWKRLQIWDQLRDTIKWARLYGGACAMILIDGQDPSTPLRANTVGKGAFRGLLVLDRWMINPILSATIQDLGPNMGKPIMYETTVGSELPSMHIHHSRLIRFDGDPLPYWQQFTENGWSASVVEQLYDRMVAFDSATQGAAQLVYKAHLRTYKVAGLRQLIAAGGPQYQAFLQSMNMIRLMQTSEGMTIIDDKDTLEYHSPGAFSGLADALTQFGQQLAGASGIPLVILFGQSPSGFSTGETDVRNYNDRIASQQQSDLSEPVRRLLDISYRSLFGNPPPQDFSFTFNSLWQMTEKERAETAGQIVTAVTTAHAEAILTTKAAMKELKQSSRETGLFTNITDEEIEAADDSLPAPDMEALGAPGEGPGMGHNGGPALNPPGQEGDAAPGLKETAGGLPGGLPAATPQPKPQKPPAALFSAPAPEMGLKADGTGALLVKGTPKNVRLRLDPEAIRNLNLRYGG